MQNISLNIYLLIAPIITQLNIHGRKLKPIGEKKEKPLNRYSPIKSGSKVESSGYRIGTFILKKMNGLGRAKYEPVA